MRLGLSIVGILLAAIVLFTGLAMAESWEEVFGPFFAGEQEVPKAPPNEQLEAALRSYNTALERGEPVGPERSAARRMAVADHQFFRRYGVRQVLHLRELEVTAAKVTGPGVYTVTTRELSELTISRTLTKPRAYRLRGEWEYVVRELEGRLQVVDVKPQQVALEDREASDAGTQTAPGPGAPEEQEPPPPPPSPGTAPEGRP